MLRINCETSGTQQNNINWPTDPVGLQIELAGNRADVVSSTNMVDTRWSCNQETTL